MGGGKAEYSNSKVKILGTAIQTLLFEYSVLLFRYV